MDSLGGLPQEFRKVKCGEKLKIKFADKFGGNKTKINWGTKDIGKGTKSGIRIEGWINENGNSEGKRATKYTKRE